jgi:hypothetical protein
MMLFSGCTKRVHNEPAGEEGPTPIVTIREFPEFATGMLVYNGNVDYDSLVRFFDESLTKNGWIAQASLKYTRTLFFYQKENRICFLTMQATPLNVRVEIWVAPLERQTQTVFGGHGSPLATHRYPQIFLTTENTELAETEDGLRVPAKRGVPIATYRD